MNKQLLVLMIFVNCVAIDAVYAKRQVPINAVSADSIVTLAENAINSNPMLLDSLAAELQSSRFNDSVYWYKGEMYRGIHCAMNSDFANSLRHFQNMWYYGAKNHIKWMEVDALRNMAGVYRFTGNYPKAEEKLNKALALLGPDDEMSRGKGMLLMALGMCQDVSGKPQKAFKTLESAFAIFDHVRDADLALQCISEMGYIAQNDKQYDQALKIYRSILPLLDYAKNQYGKYDIHFKIGDIYQSLGNHKEALTEYQIALTIADSNGFNLASDSLLYGMVVTSNELGLTELNNEYSARLLKSFNEETDRIREASIASITGEFSLKEKEIENELLRAEAEFAALELKNAKLLFWGILTLCILLLVAVITTVKWLHSARENRNQLAKFNAELEDKVKEKTELVIARNKRLDETSFKLAHEIRGYVATLLGARNLIEMEGTIKMVDPQIFEAFDESSVKLDITVREMINLLDQDLATQKNAESTKDDNKV